MNKYKTVLQETLEQLEIARIKQEDYLLDNAQIEHLLSHIKNLQEQVAYLRRSCERKEETIYEQYDESVGLDTKIDNALKKINDYKIYCKENKGFTEYTDIEIEAIEPVLIKIENILKEKI